MPCVLRWPTGERRERWKLICYGLPFRLRIKGGALEFMGDFGQLAERRLNGKFGSEEQEDEKKDQFEGF